MGLHLSFPMPVECCRAFVLKNASRYIVSLSDGSTCDISYAGQLLYPVHE